MMWMSIDHETTPFPLQATMQDVYDAVERGEFPFEPTYRKRVLITLRNAVEKVYGEGVRLSDIKADLEAFRSKWGDRRAITLSSLPRGYSNVSTYKDDLTRWLSALEHYLGEAQRRAAQRAQQDDWWELIGILRTDINSRALEMHENKLLGLTAIMNRARQDHRQPEHLSKAWLTKTLDATPAGIARSNLREGARLLDRLRDHGTLLVNGLLPTEPISGAKATDVRRAKAMHPASLTTSMDSWLANKRTAGGPKGAKRRSGRYRADETIKSARMGLEWYVDALIARRKIDPTASPTPAEIAREDWIKECVKAELDGELPWKPLALNSLNNYFKSAIAWLKPHSLSKFPDLSKEIREENDEFDDINGMSQRHQEWCLDFKRNEKKQELFFSMPMRLQEAAIRALRHYDKLSVVERAQAINLAVAAAMAAILTSLPLRSRSLGALTIDGPEAHLKRPGGKESHLLKVNLPKNFVKNRRPICHSIRPKKYAHPRDVIDWFIAGPREQLMKDHMPGRIIDPTRLLCGLDYRRLNFAWQSGTDFIGIPMTQHLARHAIATYLINRRPDSMPFIAALLRVSFDTVEKYYAFLDEERLSNDSDELLANELEIMDWGNADRRVAS